MPNPNRRKRRRKQLFTKGEKNKMLDSVVHPLIREHWVFRIVDDIGHAVIEQDPLETIRKFFKYTFPEIIRELLSDKSDEN